MNIKFLTLLVITAFLVGGCDKSPTSTANKSGNQPPAPIQAEAFHGQVYKSFDQRKVLTLISKDECELNEHGTILLCKYTKQNDNLRVVTTALGTSQVLYYRFTNQGLQDNDGNVLFSPEGLLEAQRQVELARKQAAEQARVLAEERAKEEQRVAAQQEAIRIVEHARVEREIPGEWQNQYGRLTITRDGSTYSGVNVPVYGNIRRVMRGELLLNNNLELKSVSMTLVDPSRASDASSRYTFWLILSADGASLTGRWDAGGLGGDVSQMKRVR